MFKKLISNLPFNPSLIDQVAFYSKRLKRESSIRRIGFVFIALAMIVQIIAIASPPQQSLASSNNDLINGGIGSAADAANQCNNNTQGYGTILANYGISCASVASAPTVTLHSNDMNMQLFSVGRIPYSKAGETPINIAGTTYYARYLWSWDNWGNWSTYSALQVSGSSGTMYILYDCGNLVFVGLPPTPTPPPTPKPVCSNWYLGWGFWYQSPDGDVNKATNTTTKDPCAVYPPPVCAGWYQGWGFWYQSPDGNVNLATRTTTTDPCKSPPPPQKPVCLNWYQGWGFWYQSPDGNVNHATKTTTTNPCTTPPPPPQPPKCPENSAILATDAKCKPCEKSQTREDKSACLEYGKKASNDTQGITDANGTTAKASDVITYTLSVKNNGKADIDKFVIQENISDVLDYADVVTLNGGTKDSNNIVKWPAQTIKAGKTITQQFTVKVKNPIPGTPASSSDPGHFDLTMTNVYGNTVNIKLPATVSKTAEVVSTTLPNTGPGATLTAGFALMTIVGYFFARSRLLSKELGIIKADYTATGEF